MAKVVGLNFPLCIADVINNLADGTNVAACVVAMDRPSSEREFNRMLNPLCKRFWRNDIPTAIDVARDWYRRGIIIWCGADEHTGHDGMRKHWVKVA